MALTFIPVPIAMKVCFIKISLYSTAESLSHTYFPLVMQEQHVYQVLEEKKKKKKSLDLVVHISGPDSSELFPISAFCPASGDSHVNLNNNIATG